MRMLFTGVTFLIDFLFASQLHRVIHGAYIEGLLLIMFFEIIITRLLLAASKMETIIKDLGWGMFYGSLMY
jgi:hypothetical protein